MHRVNVYVHYFFVPNRLLFNNWEMFITRGRDGEQAPPAPYFNINDVGAVDPELMVASSLWDYMGGKPLNPDGYPFASTQRINALPFRAYQKSMTIFTVILT